MPITTCTHCGGDLAWSWTEAFDKFGFQDGDGQVMTDVVVETLHAAGYDATADAWGFHNVVITSIQRDGVEQIPAGAKVGYDDPRDYLPVEIVRLLDEKLSDDAEVAP